MNQLNYIEKRIKKERQQEEDKYPSNSLQDINRNKYIPPYKRANLSYYEPQSQKINNFSDFQKKYPQKTYVEKDLDVLAQKNKIGSILFKMIKMCFHMNPDFNYLYKTNVHFFDMIKLLQKTKRALLEKRPGLERYINQAFIYNLDTSQGDEFEGVIFNISEFAPWKKVTKTLLNSFVDKVISFCDQDDSLQRIQEEDPEFQRLMNLKTVDILAESQYDSDQEIFQNNIERAENELKDTRDRLTSIERETLKNHEERRKCAQEIAELKCIIAKYQADLVQKESDLTFWEQKLAFGEKNQASQVELMKQEGSQEILIEQQRQIEQRRQNFERSTYQEIKQDIGNQSNRSGSRLELASNSGDEQKSKSILGKRPREE